MRRTLTGLLGLITLAVALPVAAEENRSPAEQELRQQNRRREQLHQQLRELLASPDPDVQRLGIAFHTLGGYNAADLVPLTGEEQDLAWAAREVVESAPVTEELVQGLIAQLGADPYGGVEWGEKILEARVPGWRDRRDVDGLIRQLIQWLRDEEEQDHARDLLKPFGPRLVPHIPRLLALAEQASEPEQVAVILAILPWNALGDHQVEVNRRVSELLVRHQDRYLDRSIWEAWMEQAVALTGAEPDRLVRESLRYRESDADIAYAVLWAVTPQSQTLDRLHPGWRKQPFVREAIAQFRIELQHQDAARRRCAVSALIGLGETRHPELREYLFKLVRSGQTEDWEAADWLMRTVRWQDLDLAPEDRQQLLQHWLRQLERPPSIRWGIALHGLAWLGADAKPAVPRLLAQLERMLWDVRVNWHDQDVEWRLVCLWPYDPGEFDDTLNLIEPGWKDTLAGRRIATQMCDRLQWQLTHRLEMELWEQLFWSGFDWTTPALRSLILDRLLKQVHLGERSLLGKSLNQYHWRHCLDGRCPGWHQSVEARQLWSRLEPEYPWPADAELNQLFVRLTLHHPGLSRDQQRGYLLKAVTTDFILDQDYQAALDELDPDWPQSPEARQALPKLVEGFQSRLADETDTPWLDQWRVLKRLGAADQFEFPFLLRLWLNEPDIIPELLSDLQLPSTSQAKMRRLQELCPEYLQSGEVRRYRLRALEGLAAEYDGDRSDALELCLRPDLLQCRSQEDFRLLPGLLARLARWKEDEARSDDGRQPPVARQLWKIRQNLREQKILDGPILLPEFPATQSGPLP